MNCRRVGVEQVFLVQALQMCEISLKVYKK